MLVVLDRAEILILIGGRRPRGLHTIGLLKRDIRGIGWLMRTTGNALSVGNDNLLHVERHITGRACSARSDNPLHVVNIISAWREGISTRTSEFPFSDKLGENAADSAFSPDNPKGI